MVISLWTDLSGMLYGDTGHEWDPDLGVIGDPIGPVWQIWTTSYRNPGPRPIRHGQPCRPLTG